MSCHCVSIVPAFKMGREEPTNNRSVTSEEGGFWGDPSRYRRHWHDLDRLRELRIARLGGQSAAIDRWTVSWTTGRHAYLASGEGTIVMRCAGPVVNREDEVGADRQRGGAGRYAQICLDLFGRRKSL